MTLKRNIVSNILGQAALMVLSLVATRLLFKQLGADILGVIYFSVTVTFLFIILADTGITHTLTREVAAHREKDRKYVFALINTASTITWCAYLLAFLIIAGSAPFLVGKWLQLENADVSATTFAFIVISAALLFSIPRSVYGSVISGCQRLDLWNIMNITSVGLQQLGTIGVLWLGGNLYHVAWWYLISGLLSVILFGYTAVRLMGHTVLHLGFQWDTIRRNLHYGSHLFANSIISYFLYHIDRWVISRFLPASMLGYYGVAQGLASKGNMIPGAIASASFPALASSVVNKERLEWTAQYNKLHDLNSYIFIPISAAIAMLGVAVMTIVFNREIVEMAWLPLLILALGNLIMGMQSIPYMLMLAMKKPEISVRANIRALIITIPAAVFLTVTFGLPGAAMTTAVASISHMVFFLPRFSAECLHAKAWVWYRRSAVLTLFGLLSYGLPWLLLWSVGLGLDIYALSIAYVVGTLFYLPSGWRLVGPELKEVIGRQFPGLRARIGMFR